MTEGKGQPPVGIAGHRSFIGAELALRLEEGGREVERLDKATLGTQDLSHLDCAYLLLGRARPTPAEQEAEVGQVAELIMNPHPPRRVVYVSSMRRGSHKDACESMLSGWQKVDPRRHDLVVLRPGAVFGPAQDPDSEMLIPSLVRRPWTLELRSPDLPTDFISVTDLAVHMARFADPTWHDWTWAGQPGSMYVLPGTLSLTPRQVRELYRAFAGLSSRLGG